MHYGVMLVIKGVLINGSVTLSQWHYSLHIVIIVECNSIMAVEV